MRNLLWLACVAFAAKGTHSHVDTAYTERGDAGSALHRRLQTFEQRRRRLDNSCVMSEDSFISRGTGCSNISPLPAAEGSWESCSADCLDVRAGRGGVRRLNSARRSPQTAAKHVHYSLPLPD